MRFLLISFALLPQLALAQSGGESAAALEPITSPYLLKLTGGLMLVVVVIFVLAWLVKRFNLAQQAQGGLIRIVAGVSIGTRDRIVLLQVGNEQILVGLTPGRIEKLHTLAEPLPVSGDGAETTASFADKINRLMGDRGSS